MTAPPIDYETKQPPARKWYRRDDLAYVAPMAVFLLLTQVGASWPKLFVASYVAKTLVVPFVLWFFWQHYTKIRWTHLGLGAVMGVLGLVQWVGMEKLLLHFWPHYPRLSAEVFDPTKAFASPTVMWLFICVRWAGAFLLVPVMEELFWRDFGWRSLLAPNDFNLAEVGERDWKALLIISAVFSMVHIQWITAIGWGLMVGWLLTYTRSLGACIVMHAVTNFLLGGWVLWSHFVKGRNEWYFW
jgi:CAAX prenyl protease-like protein